MVTDPARLEFTEKLYLSARSERSIQIAICKRFGVSGRQARNYIRRIKDRLASRFEKNPAAASARAESMFLETWKAAKIKDDPRTMATVAERLAALHNAIGPVKHELSGPNGGPITTVAKVALMPAVDDPADLADDLPADAAASDVPGEPS